MPDFTDGSTWFAAGLGTTLVFVALIVLVALLARKTQPR